MWRNHTRFWLTKETIPVEPLLYADVVDDTPAKLTAVMRFFGAVFDRHLLPRHCCVLNSPVNKSIQRQRSPIDDYKVGFTVYPTIHTVAIGYLLLVQSMAY